MAEINKTAVVTGVSTGIGRAIASALTGAGWRVFGSVRKEKDAADATAALGDAFTPLFFDVTDQAAINAAARKVETALDGATLGALVNNAGVAVAGPVRYIPLEEIERQFDINVFGVIRVTKAFLPHLGADKRFAGPPGKIINMSSVAGGLASPMMAPYAMSKHALEALTDSLRRELAIHGIDAVAIGPGAVKTPIWAKADDIDVTPYLGTEYEPLMNGMKSAMQTFGDSGLPPEDVGALALDMLEGRKPGARYAILREKFMSWTLPRMLPKRMVDKAIWKRFGITPKNG